LFYSSSLEQSPLDVPTPLERRPPPVQRLVSVSVSVPNEHPTSPAERYIAIRAQMLYDVNIPQPTTPYSIHESQTPTPLNQPLRRPVAATVSQGSLGFPIPSNASVHPSIVTGIQLKEKQATKYPPSHVSQQDNISPSQFQPAPSSNQSTADYPPATASVANSSTFRTQMSHDQHMQVWRQKQMEKIRKHRRHRYVYGPPPQPFLADKVSNASILTPQILHETTKQQQVPPTPNTVKFERQPTQPPFHFPMPSRQMPISSSSITSDTQSKPINQTSRINQRSAVSPQRMDSLDEHPQEISHKNKSSKKTSTLTHRVDSQSSITDTTEI
jgi:hypothetical protein